MTTNQDIADALGTEDRSQDAGTAGYEWTSETFSTDKLAKIQGHRSKPSDSPVGCCSGIFVAEYASEAEGGGFLHWRFYKDPEWDA